MCEKYQLLTAESITLIIGLYFLIRCWFGFKKKPDMRIDEIPDEWVRNRCRNTEKMQKYFSLVGCVLGALLTLISLFYILHTCFFTIPQETKAIFNSGWITLPLFFSLLFAILTLSGYNLTSDNKVIYKHYKKFNFQHLADWSDNGKDYEGFQAGLFIGSRIKGYQWISIGSLLLLYLSISLFFISLLDIKSGYAYYLTICELVF